ncbi:efflux RND transporter permease subunit [Marinospirillum sp. MEB164]|uniref:Efflux RND transporter permease subunit n=1 Tax=Marinospirillum alkalitolerans TaxID=3123374 RepID=A0ABW8PY76_9GAMM
MNWARLSIEKPLATWLLVLVCFLGGIWALMTLGRLEDPNFAIKKALVVTLYPGATAQEVEEEVTEHIESAIQQLPQLRHITSRSMPGRSEITVVIEDRYTTDALPQVWDELRRRVSDAQSALPRSVYPSRVVDDFGDVFGIFYAVTAEGFSDYERRELARFLRRELLTVPGVARVDTAGEPEEVFYLDVSHQRLTRLGLPVEMLLAALPRENSVEQAGAQRVGDQHLRLVVPPGLDSITTLEELRVGPPGGTQQLRLRDLAQVQRLPSEHPQQLIRFNGEPAFSLAIAGLANANIVDVGQAIEAHLASLGDRLPLGVELNPVYQQHQIVDQSIKDFLLNLAASVSIVILVLCLFMGWRVGLVVGSTLLLTVLGTLLFMRLLSIEMERVSLGALIIAMGMLVDNAIVVAEGMLMNIQKKMRPLEAAEEAVSRTKMPLLGATAIGVLAFAGIGLSSDITGEFLFSLFQVIAISLALSWLLAVTVTPLLGFYLLGRQAGATSETVADPYAGRSYQLYRGLLVKLIARRRTTLVLLFALTLSSFYGFTWVRQAFFPDANTPLFYVHYQLPQGSDIRATSRDVAWMEEQILQDEQVVSVSSFIGQGASRFMLTYNPEQPDPAYAELIVRVAQLEAINPLISRLQSRFETQSDLQGQVRFERLVFGPGADASIEVRFSGPDMQKLRELGESLTSQLLNEPALRDVRHNWMEQELVLHPVMLEDRARFAGISRSDLAQALRFATEGLSVGQYREGVERLPIIARLTQEERLDLSRLAERQIWSPVEKAYVPMDQIVERFDLVAEESRIHRRNRLRTLTVQAEPALDVSTHQAYLRVRALVEQMDLPTGYQVEWGGEQESSSDAKKALGVQLPVSFLAMFVITLLLFGRVKQALVVWLVVPMATVGVVLGLLLSGQPFGFLSLLGFLSLSGMLLKNAIVLVDEIDQQRQGGAGGREDLLQASVSRLRPVFLAAGTTLLGMLPLLFDAFFASMAVTIMAGLAFATLLTLVAVPLLYLSFIPEAGQVEGANE